ncbi:M14 family zinc carboxypeptidase [Bacillus sp. DTU_2020_1000418_1_SI_GHA_SEK_038]|uniref:M14 family zinc carboxypeptidase n=1 Tax=Bacillus sp. DTU_2020_1000418_1_SI_GHA_SEK_038 TaxID=3077585 RepID=UPI0028EB4F68|nr:M14 family zinc carboxypeptidase [Bacillus sp. DTU_2020_1000418_1_SI_GHA_SEK_038]WNS73740.1 M14 family zinc carboxypeptidase [Bacillus sp. DTU_2020_1000418_1_SI_GHA_SEK_038]
MSLKKKVLSVSLSSLMALGAVTAVSMPAQAVGNGPSAGNGAIQTSILHTYDSLVDYLKTQDAKQQAMELEVIGQTVKGRDIYMAKYISNPANPTILFLTQQHGNEQLTTEGALEFIKHLGTGKTKGVLDNVNVLVIPMLNADGAMGDVNFSLDNYLADGDRHLTRYNANYIDLNREHDKESSKMEPEARALHENVLQKYDIDFMIDLHHQGTLSETEGQLVSGSILYPTSPSVKPEVVEGSKKLGAVVFNAIQPTGWGHLGKYAGGSTNNIGRNGIAAYYDISTLLFEMRGMSDHYIESYAIGQKSNGYLIKQTITTLDAAVRAIADGSIESADTTFWDTLPTQTNRQSEESDE